MEAADSGATDAEKQDKDGEIQQHQTTRQGIMDEFDEKTRAVSDKENLIAEGERIREEEAYNKEKQARDEKFYDLEGLMFDEEGQLNAFKSDAMYWYDEGLNALMNDDFQYFKETEEWRKEAEKKVETAQAKYDATEALYQIEKAAKEQREFDEGVKQATQEFHDR